MAAKKKKKKTEDDFDESSIRTRMRYRVHSNYDQEHYDNYLDYHLTRPTAPEYFFKDSSKPFDTEAEAHEYAKRCVQGRYIIVLHDIDDNSLA